MSVVVLNSLFQVCRHRENITPRKMMSLHKEIFNKLINLKGHCLIFLSAIYQLFIEYFNIM